MWKENKMKWNVKGQSVKVIQTFSLKKSPYDQNKIQQVKVPLQRQLYIIVIKPTCYWYFGEFIKTSKMKNVAEFTKWDVSKMSAKVNSCLSICRLKVSHSKFEVWTWAKPFWSRCRGEFKKCSYVFIVAARDINMYRRLNQHTKSRYKRIK